jgi:hypothetical protein
MTDLLAPGATTFEVNASGSSPTTGKLDQTVTWVGVDDGTPGSAERAKAALVQRYGLPDLRLGDHGRPVVIADELLAADTSVMQWAADHGVPAPVGAWTGTGPLSIEAPYDVTYTAGAALPAWIAQIQAQIPQGQPEELRHPPKPVPGLPQSLWTVKHLWRDDLRLYDQAGRLLPNGRLDIGRFLDFVDRFIVTAEVPNLISPPLPTVVNAPGYNAIDPTTGEAILLPADVFLLFWALWVAAGKPLTLPLPAHVPVADPGVPASTPAAPAASGADLEPLLVAALQDAIAGGFVDVRTQTDADVAAGKESAFLGHLDDVELAKFQSSLTEKIGARFAVNIHGLAG